MGFGCSSQFFFVYPFFSCPCLVRTLYQLTFDLITTLMTTSRPLNGALSYRFLLALRGSSFSQTQLNNLLFLLIYLFPYFAPLILTVRLSYLNSSNLQCSPLAGRLASPEFYVSCRSPIFGTVRPFLSTMGVPFLSLSRRSLIDCLSMLKSSEVS